MHLTKLPGSTLHIHLKNPQNSMFVATAPVATPGLHFKRSSKPGVLTTTAPTAAATAAFSALASPPTTARARLQLLRRIWCMQQQVLTVLAACLGFLSPMKLGFCNSKAAAHITVILPVKSHQQQHVNCASALLFAVCCFFGIAEVQSSAASSATGTWSTAALSVARTVIAATSLPNYGLAIFPGGYGA